MVIYDFKNPRFRCFSSSKCNYSPFKNCFIDLILFKLFRNQHSDNFIQKKSRKVRLIEVSIHSCHVQRKCSGSFECFLKCQISCSHRQTSLKSLLVLGIGFVHFYCAFAPSYGHFTICFIGSNLFKAVQTFHLNFHQNNDIYILYTFKSVIS